MSFPSQQFFMIVSKLVTCIVDYSNPQKVCYQHKQLLSANNCRILVDVYLSKCIHAELCKGILLFRFRCLGGDISILLRHMWSGGSHGIAT